MPWSPADVRFWGITRHRKATLKSVENDPLQISRSGLKEMIGAHIGIILIVTGAMTAVAVIQFIFPALVLRVIFGQVPTDAVFLFLARHWALLIFCVGALLIYAAFDAPIRTPAMFFAVVEKVAIGAGVLGTPLRRHRVAIAIAAGDLLIAFIYVLALAGF